MYNINRFVLQELGILLGVPLTCEELVGVNHTTESVTDLFSFVDV